MSYVVEAHEAAVAAATDCELLNHPNVSNRGECPCGQRRFPRSSSLHSLVALVARVAVEHEESARWSNQHGMRTSSGPLR